MDLSLLGISSNIFRFSHSQWASLCSCMMLRTLLTFKVQSDTPRWLHTAWVQPSTCQRLRYPPIPRQVSLHSYPPETADWWVLLFPKHWLLLNTLSQLADLSLITMPVVLVVTEQFMVLMLSVLQLLGGSKSKVKGQDAYEEGWGKAPVSSQLKVKS